MKQQWTDTIDTIQDLPRGFAIIMRSHAPWFRAEPIQSLQWLRSTDHGL